MSEKILEDLIIKELEKYGNILENAFNCMAEMEFVVEKSKFYITLARVGKCLPLANLRITLDMFLEGKIDIGKVLINLTNEGIYNLVRDKILVNEDKLKQILSGLAASPGVDFGTAIFSNEEAKYCMDKNIDYIYCCLEMAPEDIQYYINNYCKGVISLRGGFVSHASVVCRGAGVTCVAGCGENFDDLKNIIHLYDNMVTIDGYSGKIYAGIGEVKNGMELPEIDILYKLIKLVIQYNVVTIITAPLVWRLWDAVFLKKSFINRSNLKKMMVNHNNDYISFWQPSRAEILKITDCLMDIENSKYIIEDLINFLFSQFTKQVSLGKHYLYVRPLLNPVETVVITNSNRDLSYYYGTQLTGIEFFNINHFVDFLIDIYSIKIFFSTEINFFVDDDECVTDMNFLDFTNPLGENLIINGYNVKRILIYINDVVMPPENLAMVYHLLRRRLYYWSWYKDNNVTHSEIINYLASKEYLNNTNSKLYFLCQEMNLLDNELITLAGQTLLQEIEYGK